MIRKKLPTEPPRYRTYVVRCWQERSMQAGREMLVWRFCLEDPNTYQRRGFTTLEALLLSIQADLIDEQLE